MFANNESLHKLLLDGNQN